MCQSVDLVSLWRDIKMVRQITEYLKMVLRVQLSSFIQSYYLWLYLPAWRKFSSSRIWEISWDFCSLTSIAIFLTSLSTCWCGDASGSSRILIWCLLHECICKNRYVRCDLYCMNRWYAFLTLVPIKTVVSTRDRKIGDFCIPRGAAPRDETM